MEEKEKKLSLSFWLVLLAAAGMYALLAMNHNIWADEAYTFAMLRHSFADICRITAVDSHPPLYYLAAKLFTMPFDYSEYAVRLFSGACSLLVVGIGGWQLTKLFNRKVGLLFMVLYALFPFILERSMETRMYPLAALGIFLCALFAYRAWQDNKARHWVGFVCGGLCAAYSHYFALAAAGILYGLLFLCTLFKKRQLLKSWLIAALVTIALYAPWLGSLIGQLAYKVDHEYWIAPITPATLIDYAKGLFQATGFSFFYLFFGAVTLWLLVRTCWRHQAAPLLALAACVLTVGVGVGASLILRPVFIIRYLSPCAPLLIFFLAWGLSDIKKETVYGAAMGILLTGFLTNLACAVVDVKPKQNMINQETLAQYSQAQAYVMLSDNAYHVHQSISYYNSQTPIYTPETMGDANPYPNVYPMEDFDPEGLDTLLVFANRDSDSTDGFPEGYDAAKVGTYRDLFFYFDLWLLEKQPEASE